MKPTLRYTRGLVGTAVQTAVVALLARVAIHAVDYYAAPLMARRQAQIKQELDA